MFQDHYDWGLRAIKSVLVVAGALKRSDPGRPEDQVTAFAFLWTVHLFQLICIYTGWLRVSVGSLFSYLLR